MKSEILIEFENNIKLMEKLIERQQFTVGDAHRFLARYYNIVRKIEQLTASRDLWKAKYTKLRGEHF